MGVLQLWIQDFPYDPKYSFSNQDLEDVSEALLASLYVQVTDSH